MAYVFQQQILYCFIWSTNQFILLNIFFSFSSDFSAYQFDCSLFWSLNLLSCASYLANLFPNFWLFLESFWLLWLLVTVNKPCHVPHALRVTTWGTIFTETPFGVSKEWVISWSHVSVVTNLDTFPKKFLAVRPKTAIGIRKRKKIMEITKRFALHANVFKKSRVL